MTRPTLSFAGPGNITGPRTRQLCLGPCGEDKAETAFKLDNRTGTRSRVCRACWAAAGRLRSKRTPIHVKRASAMGPCMDGRWGSDQCPECDERLCWDTDGRGGLVALDFLPRTVHVHQPHGTRTQ